MKSSLALSIGAVLAAATLASLAGCGQPGALYLPKPPGQAAKPAKATPGSQPDVERPDPTNAPGLPPDYAPMPTSTSSPATQR